MLAAPIRFAIHDPPEVARVPCPIVRVRVVRRALRGAAALAQRDFSKVEIKPTRSPGIYMMEGAAEISACAPGPTACC
jgi:hypothetical protein